MLLRISELDGQRAPLEPPPTRRHSARLYFPAALKIIIVKQVPENLHAETVRGKEEELKYWPICETFSKTKNDSHVCSKRDDRVDRVLTRVLTFTKIVLQGRRQEQPRGADRAHQVEAGQDI